MKALNQPPLTEGQEYRKARALAFSGKAHRAEALALLKAHLTRFPNDTEARILYGTVLSWDGQYDEARVQLQMVLAKNPTHSEALPALINVEFWSGHPARALVLAKRGLAAHPKDVTYALDEAKALHDLGDDWRAARVYDQALSFEPKNQELRRTVWNFKRVSSEYVEVSLDHTYEAFNQIFGPQNETRLSVRTATPFGSVTYRENRADRFGETSYQSQINYWPGFGHSTYAYLSGGYSDDANLYPRWRAGAELFHDTHGYEFSGGYRYLHFASDVNIWTFSVGKYHGDWFFDERTFLTPGSAGWSNTEEFSARRFFSDEGLHDYAQAFFSRGASPAQAQTTLNILVLDSYRGGVEVDKAIGHFAVSLTASIAKEQQTYTNNLIGYTFDGTIYYRF